MKKIANTRCRHCQQAIIEGIEHPTPAACVRYLMARQHVAQEAWRREQDFVKERVRRLTIAFPVLSAALHQHLPLEP